jgi:hypothetical protein
VRHVSSRQSRRKSSFDFAAKRRREIVLHARYVGAADTEDFGRWLIAWVWHNRKATDQIWSVMECAKSMGGKITEVEASTITEEASITRKHLSADNLARFLGVTFEQRQRLGLTTIGSVNVGKRARKELRKRQNCIAHERRRRAQGIQSRAEYEAHSVAAKAREEGVSRMTIYRRRKTAEQAKNPPVLQVCPHLSFLSSEDGPVTPDRGVRGHPSEASPRRKQGDSRLPTAWMSGADVYAALPLELRLLALGLSNSKNFARKTGMAA